MSNKVFSDYATSSAFRIDLSQNMIQWLLYEYTKSTTDPLVSIPNGHFINGEQALERRGLLKQKYRQTPDGLMRNGYTVTEAGIKVAELCLIAGFQLQNNKTCSYGKTPATVTHWFPKPQPPNQDKPVNVGTIGHVDHGKTALTTALTKALDNQDKAGGEDIETLAKQAAEAHPPENLEEWADRLSDDLSKCDD